MSSNLHWFLTLDVWWSGSCARAAACPHPSSHRPCPRYPALPPPAPPAPAHCLPSPHTGCVGVLDQLQRPVRPGVRRAEGVYQGVRARGQGGLAFSPPCLPFRACWWPWVLQDCSRLVPKLDVHSSPLAFFATRLPQEFDAHNWTVFTPHYIVWICPTPYRSRCARCARCACCACCTCFAGWLFEAGAGAGQPGCGVGGAACPPGAGGTRHGWHGTPPAPLPALLAHALASTHPLFLPRPQLRVQQPVHPQGAVLLARPRRQPDGGVQRQRRCAGAAAAALVPCLPVGAWGAHDLRCAAAAATWCRCRAVPAARGQFVACALLAAAACLAAPPAAACDWLCRLLPALAGFGPPAACAATGCCPHPLCRGEACNLAVPYPPARHSVPQENLRQLCVFQMAKDAGRAYLWCACPGAVACTAWVRSARRHARSADRGGARRLLRAGTRAPAHTLLCRMASAGGTT